MDPTIAVVLYTYSDAADGPRNAYALRALDSLRANLSYSGPLLWHIADDGSAPGHIDKLLALCRKWDDRDVATWSATDRRGYGGSYNLATQYTHGRAFAVLAVEDDWELVRPLNIDPLVRALVEGEDEPIRCIRLGYLGWTNPLRGHLVHVADQTFLMLDPDSPETHVFAGHPRLETVEFERDLGAWPEGLKAGYTEMNVSQRPQSRRGVVWPLDLCVNASQQHANTFAHIGEVQA